MLKNSFCFLEGIGLKTEKNIWKQGIHTWEEFLAADRIKGISPKHKFYYNNRLRKAKTALYNDDISYFLTFPSTETWRLYEWFKEDAAYIDIETGINNKNFGTNITIITLYDGFDTKTFVKEINLHKRLLKQELQRYRLIISFNGASFDLPVIKKHFSLQIDVPHIDLRFLCKKAGLSGNLKQIERSLNITRDKDIEESEGRAAYLWKMWHSTRNKKYLNRLVDYNQADAINLKKISEIVIATLKQRFSEEIAKKEKKTEKSQKM